jgi:membrane protein CcdC involved in cytochrome C biogenesis
MNDSYYFIAAAIAALVLWRRTRSMYRPIKGKGLRLLIPILFLIPASSMFLNPAVHASGWEWVAALAIGMLLSVPLIWTTRYEMREDHLIYTKKNIGFAVAFVAVLAIRFALKNSLSMIDPQTKAALFMTLVFGYLVPWRVVSYFKFRRVYALLPKKG